MTKKKKSRILVFILSLLCYLGLTSFTDIQELIAGIIVSLIVSLIAGRFLLQNDKFVKHFLRIFKAIKYLFLFLWEMAKANIHVAYLVLHPDLPIKPGIVKIKSNLKNDSSITALANSITLTPGTLTIDVNDENHDLYIHCIDVKSENVLINTNTIGGKFEKLLAEVFE